MIPKIIHYFWAGPDPEYNYFESWKQYCPDYKIERWTLNNIPVSIFPKLQLLIDAKKYSLLSDFVRHYALWTYGGFYLDTDIELIQPLDDLRNLNSFVNIEGPPAFANAAVCGAEPCQQFQSDALRAFFEFDFQKLLTRQLTEYQNLPPEVIVSPYLVTKIILKYKGTGDKLTADDLSKIQTYDQPLFTTLPKEYFFPFNYNEKYSPACITPNTHGIHWWKKSWG